MFNLINKIKEVFLLNVTENYISYKKNNKLIVNESTIEINPFLWHIDEMRNLIWLKDDLWNNYVIDLIDNKIKRIEYNLAVGCVNKNYFVAFYNNKLNLFDIETFNQIGSLSENITSFKNCTFINNDLLIQNSSFIQYFSLQHPKKPLWQFNLPQLGTFRLAGDEYTYDVVRFIDVWNNLLLVQLKNARLIALDIKTGELKQDLPINQTNPLKSPLFYDQYTKMHLVEDKIIWLSNQTLIHIDLHTFKAQIIKEYYTKPRDNQWRFMHNTYFEGKIYFTADYAWQYVTPSYIGVMDANTGDVLWSQQLKNTGGLPEAPKVTKDKLYIRTSTAMLHIFEKTNNATT